MNPIFNKYFFSFIFTGLILILAPTNTFAQGISNINEIFIVTQQKNSINYEKSQPSSIDNPVVDIVIGLLIAATIIPLATWWYFSK